MKNKKFKLPTKYLSFFIPLFLILGTALIYFISKGYRLNISNGEIEKTGVLTFTTIPRKATVYVDNEYIGRSPKAVSGLNEETHSIKITKNGYQDWLMDIVVKAEQSIPIEPVLFLKEPITETLFPDQNSNDTVIENLYFDPDGQMAIFTVVTNADTENNIEESTKPKTLQIWAYTVNKRFWEFEPRPRKIAEFTEATDNSLSLKSYDITVSKNAQKILFSTGPLSTDPQNTQKYFILKTDVENKTPMELEDLAEYKNISPAWSNDSQYLIFSINGELRSINVDSKVQTILDEKGEDETFIWTSDKDGLVYTVEEKDQIYTISRIHSNGEDKVDIVKNIQKSQERNLFEGTETTKETKNTELTTIIEDDTDDIPHESSTLTEETIYIDTINKIRITDDSKNLMLLTDTQILLYTLESNEIRRILTKSPGYIAATETNRKFIFLSGNNQLVEYTSKIDDGDPIHQIGSKTLITLNQEIIYTMFRWYPEYSNIIYSTQITNTRETHDASEITDDEETENIEVETLVVVPESQYKLHVINTDSLQTFNVFDEADSPLFAIGNSGKYIVTLCNNMKLCKVTIHE